MIALLESSQKAFDKSAG